MGAEGGVGVGGWGGGGAAGEEEESLWAFPSAKVPFGSAKGARWFGKGRLEGEENGRDNDRIERRKLKVLQSPDSAANCLQHVRWSGQGSVVCKSRATQRAFVTCNTASVCHVQHAVCHVVGRDRSAVKSDRAEMAFVSGLFHLQDH